MARPARAGTAPRRPSQRAARQPKTLLRALTLIFVADISTSLDNVLAVAGVARDQPAWVLFVGLALSVALTGFAAVGVARLLHRWPWIGYIGLVVVLFVAGHMIWDGAHALELGVGCSRLAAVSAPRTARSIRRPAASSILRNSTSGAAILRPAGTRESSAAASGAGPGRRIGLAHRQRRSSRPRTG